MSNMGRPVINKHKVPAKQWRKWSNARKAKFNRIMYAMRPTVQFTFMPAGIMLVRADWNVLRFNAAWLLSEVE